ncbi:hypothetical protein PIB30_052961 [Stylosanthes scabra]|uniref:SMP domain-containing protein n=1 Tax=Stylosanthes scabra TaxID=79078 RepID=A0ABU6RJ14_9FABA|nr:hypothetical protein [Stylosanthes scabra]
MTPSTRSPAQVAVHQDTAQPYPMVAADNVSQNPGDGALTPREVESIVSGRQRATNAERSAASNAKSLS